MIDSLSLWHNHLGLNIKRLHDMANLELISKHENNHPTSLSSQPSFLNRISSHNIYTIWLNIQYIVYCKSNLLILGKLAIFKHIKVCFHWWTTRANKYVLCCFLKMCLLSPCASLSGTNNVLRKTTFVIYFEVHINFLQLITYYYYLLVPIEL